MEKRPEETLYDIHRLMERSTRFRSLSGFSLIAAGICGLLGMWWINTIVQQAELQPAMGEGLINRLVLAASSTLVIALAAGLLFTWLKMRKGQLPVWNIMSRKVVVHFAIPMVTGGALVLAMLFYQQYRFIAAACLLFYGLALINASHYTLKEVRYLGLFEILFGIANLAIGHELLCLTFGFGIMNILYGIKIWYTYRRERAA